MQSLIYMKEELLAKIEDLILKCPSDWANLAAAKLNKSNRWIYSVRSGRLGKRGYTVQIQLINALKEISEEHQQCLKQAIV